MKTLAEQTFPAFMPLPKGCERGTKSIFDDVVCIDTAICQYYCTAMCPEFIAFREKRKALRKKLKAHAEQQKAAAAESLTEQKPILIRRIVPPQTMKRKKVHPS